MSDVIGFFGAGNLGIPVARNLMARGYKLAVYNRTSSKVAPLEQEGAQHAERPLDAVTPGGTIVSLLWDDASVEDLVASSGFLQKLGKDGVHISMSTISPTAAKRLAARHREHGSHWVEAPIFGRPEAAVARQLWVPIAGTAHAQQRARPLIEAMGAQGIFDFGEAPGAAVLVKIIGNFLIVSAGRSLLEGIGMADQYGIDPHKVVDMLTQTLFTAPIYQSYGRAVASRKATALGQSPIPAKDLGLFKQTAHEVNAPANLSSFLLDMLQR